MSEVVRGYDELQKSNRTISESETTAESTVSGLVNFQTDLVAKLADAIDTLAVHLEPIMRDDPRSKSDPTIKKPNQPLLAEMIDANNWRIEKAIGDIMSIQRLSAL